VDVFCQTTRNRDGQQDLNTSLIFRLEEPNLAAMKTITIELPDGVFKWLATAARRRRQSPADVARQALAAAAQTPTTTLGELMADLKGIGAGRHTDLSTNKKHLADFGR